MPRLCAACLLLALVACSAPGRSSPASPPKPRSSGIDRATFDTSVRPQDDLFTHVNGAWLAKTEIPADKSSYGTFDILSDQALANLRAIAEEAASSNAAPASEAQKIGNFYESFMNEAKADALGVTPLALELAAIDALNTTADLARYVARMSKLNLINPLVGYVDGDAQQPDRETLYVYQGGLGRNWQQDPGR